MGARILTVEDDERIQAAMRLALEDEGYTVIEAASGEEALEAFARRPADVVLIDLMLPGIDGFEVCRSIRRTSDVPIVMVTARTDTHDVVAGLEAGADDYVTKPFVPKELSARIRALLRRARSTDSSPSSLVFGDLEIRPDAGWRQFLFILEWHARKAGREAIRIDPRNTSQICSGCGAKAKRRLRLADRLFACQACGLVIDRDRNAARNLNPRRLGCSYRVSTG